MHGSDAGRQAGGRRSADVRALAAVPALAGCGEALLERIADLGTELRRRPGAVLQRAGRPVRQALVVVDGVVAEQAGDGVDQEHGTGHLIGAGALAGGAPVAERADDAPEQRHGTGHLIGAGALAGGAPVADRAVVAVSDVRVLVYGALELHDVARLLEEASERRASATSLLRRLERRPRRVAVGSAWAPATPSLA